MSTNSTYCAEIKRLKGIIAEALLMLNRAGYAGSEYTGCDSLLRAVEAALAAPETVRRIKAKAIIRLHEQLDDRDATIRSLRHQLDRQIARADVAEALLRERDRE